MALRYSVGLAPAFRASLTPKVNPTSGPSRSLRLLHVTRPTIFSSLRTPIAQKTSPIASAISRRTFFTSSRQHAMRNNYFPQGRWTPPPNQSWFQRLRRRIDGYPPQTVIYGLIGLNVGIFLLWQYAQQSWTRFRDPALYQFMQKNFVMSERNVLAGRVWTLITSCFSHSHGDHILVNLLGLYFVAPAAAGLIGSSAFLGLYLTGGLCSSLASLAWHRVRGDLNTGSEGASGAIYSTLGFYGAMFPTAQILMFFVIPMPVWVALGGIFAWDLFSAVSRPHSGTDSAGHIGGIAYGLIAAYRLRRGGGMGGMGRMFRR